MKIKVKQIWDIELPKDATLGQLKKMAEAISSSYDISDISFTDPIVEYLNGGD